MFFNLILLNRQHHARFGNAWIAATRGIQHLSKKDVLALDICKLCEDIAEYVCSESDSPRSRFSLRLSAVLINGTMRIHRQRAVYFIEDLFRFMTSISRPVPVVTHLMLEESGMFATPPTPVPRKRGKKRRTLSEVSTPQSELERILSNIIAKESLQVETVVPQEFVFEARTDEVTLHEEQPQRRVVGEEFDFGDLGVLPTEEELIREISQMEEPQPPPRLPLQPIEEIPEPRVEGIVPMRPSEEPPRRRPARLPSPASFSDPDVGPVIIAVEAQIHAPVDAEVPPRERERRAPIRPSEMITELPTVEEIVAEVPIEQRALLQPAVLVEMQEDAVRQRDRQVTPRKKRVPKVDKDLQKLIISTKPTRIVRINRCETQEVEWTDINPSPLPRFKLKTPNLTYLLDMYMVQEPIDVQRRHKVSEVSLEDSATLRKKSGRVTSPVEISGEGRVVPPIIERIEERISVPEVRISEFVEVPGEVAVPVPEEVMVETPQVVPETRVEVAPPLMASTPVKRRTTVEERTMEQVLGAPSEEALLESPRKKRRLFREVEVQPGDLDFITVPSELLSRELTSEAALIAQDSVEPVLLPLLTPQERQQDIVNKIFVRGRSTLEDVCQRPINKMNIARAFSDLLVLCKHGYVTLIPADDSIELKFVDRGPKLTR